MTSLPPELEPPGVYDPGAVVIAWRIDQKIYEKTWDSGTGAYLEGGRWNSIGRGAVYCSLDPATTVLELGVHRTLVVLNRVPHILTRLLVIDPSSILVIRPEDVPNPNWLGQGYPSAGQQAFGDNALQKHGIIVVPSCASKYSWNLVFDVTVAAGRWRMVAQEPLALDPRRDPRVKPKPAKP